MLSLSLRIGEIVDILAQLIACDVTLCVLGIVHGISHISLKCSPFQRVEHLLGFLVCLRFLVVCLEKLVVLLAQVLLLQFEA